MPSTPPRPYLVSWRSVPDAPLLLCLPPAGTGAGRFRTWQELADDRFEVVGVQLPGREERWPEPPAASVDAAVAAIISELAPRLRGRALVVYGHSLGGLLGYEIVRTLAAEHGIAARHLVVGACRAPHLWVGAGRRLADDIGELTRGLLARVPDLDEEDLELWRELLAEDAELSLTYTRRDPVPVPCPVQAWGGEDDPLAVPAQLEAWHAYTVAEFRHRRFPGDHAFHEDSAPELVSILRSLP